MLSAAANHLVRVFLAPGCVGCHELLTRPLEGPVCAACWHGVRRITPPWCAVCGDALPSPLASTHCDRCRSAPPRFSVARSAGFYEGSLRHVIHAFKYRHCRVLAGPLAALVRQAGGDALTDADAVVPVPLHPVRALQRGFNQADDLATHLGLPVWRVLRRTKSGPPQAKLPAQDRHTNVQQAFAAGAVCDLMAPWRDRRLQDRTVVLVDDVMTTGATLDACSGALLEAGVRSVRAVTVARAVAGRPQPRPEPRRLETAPR